MCGSYIYKEAIASGALVILGFLILNVILSVGVCLIHPTSVTLITSTNRSYLSDIVDSSSR